MVSIAGALVINIGTLSAHWVEAMKLAMKKSRRSRQADHSRPGGSRRDALPQQGADGAARKLPPPTIIRGNGSEILALAGASIQTKGVDSTADSMDSIGAAQALSSRFGSVVSVSGAVDVIVHGNRTGWVSNGVPLMTKVTGMGLLGNPLSQVHLQPFAAIRFEAAVFGSRHDGCLRRVGLPEREVARFVPDRVFG